MSLDRKDIRAKLDPDTHEQLVAICEADGIDIAVFVERVVLAAVEHDVHRSNRITARTAHLGIAGKLPVKSGRNRE